MTGTSRPDTRIVINAPTALSQTDAALADGLTPVEAEAPHTVLVGSAWYRDHEFPQYQPEFPSITTVAHSVNCADSVGTYMAATGLKMGESSDEYGLDWVECLGQCQAAPNMLLNGKLYTDVDPAKIPELLGGDR